MGMISKTTYIDCQIMPFPQQAEQQNAMQALEAAQDQMEARLQKQNDIMLEAMFKRIDEMGQLKRALKEEKFRLTSENTLLKHQITELIISNESKWKAQAETIIGKIEIVYQQFDFLYQDLMKEQTIAKKQMKNKEELKIKLGEKSTEYHQIVYHRQPQYGEACGVRALKHYPHKIDNQMAYLKKLQEDSFKLIEEAKTEVQKSRKNMELQLITSVEDRQAVIFPNNAISQVFYAFEQESQRKIEKHKHFNSLQKKTNLQLINQKIELKEVHEEAMSIYNGYINTRLVSTSTYLENTISQCEIRVPLELAASISTHIWLSLPYTRCRHKKMSEMYNIIASRLREIQNVLPVID